MIEQTMTYKGLYFVLMGRLSPLDGIGPKDIHLDKLIARAADGVVTEVVLATNFTNEGEATAHYIGEMLKDRGLKLTRIARGIPKFASQRRPWTADELALLGKPRAVAALADGASKQPLGT